MKPQEVLFKEAYVILQNAKKITNELDEVINLVTEQAKQNKHIVLTGVGKSSSIAQKTAATFSSIGIPSFFIDPYDALHGSLGAILENQVVIGISKSGETEELNFTFEECGLKNAKLVCITTNPESTLDNIVKKYKGININLECEFESDALNKAPTCSSILFLSVCDAIGCCASYNLGFTKEEFLKNHPSGALGKNLKQELKK